MRSQERKYLNFHHSPTEAVTPPYCASGQSESRSPCLSTPVNINLTGAPPAVCPWEEKPARSRGTAAQPRILCGETAGCCRGAGGGILVLRPRRAGPRGGLCWRPFQPGARRQQFLKVPLGARKTEWKRCAKEIYLCVSHI